MKKKKIIIALTAVLLFFGGMNVTWLVYRYRHFSAIASSDTRFTKNKHCKETMYQFEDKGMTATIFFPEYLKSNGNYCVTKGTSEDDYIIGITAKPHLFSDMRFQINVQAHTDNDAVYYFEVDKNFNVTYDMGDSEKILKADGEEIRAVFDIAKDHFYH